MAVSAASANIGSNPQEASCPFLALRGVQRCTLPCPKLGISGAVAVAMVARKPRVRSRRANALSTDGSSSTMATQEDAPAMKLPCHRELSRLSRTGIKLAFRSMRQGSADEQKSQIEHVLYEVIE